MRPTKIHFKFPIVSTDLIEFGACEKSLSAEQYMEDGPQGKDIANRLNVLRMSQINDLWSHVARSATPEKEIFCHVSMSG